MKENYRVVKTVEFTAERKMMSVVVQKESTGEYFVYSKGADCKIFPLLSKDSRESESTHHLLNNLKAYTHRGLRTLVFAYKKLDTLDILKPELIDEGSVENDLEQIGLTAIEDPL